MGKKETRVPAQKKLNEKKKEYLWRYRDAMRMIARIESELEELEAMKASKAINYDGLPSGSNHSDLSDYIAGIDERKRKLNAEWEKRIDLYQDIERRIEGMKSQNENDVLFYRYIKGLDWWEVAEKMGYSERHVTRIHGEALAHFELPKMS